MSDTTRFFHRLSPIKTRLGMKAPKRDKKEKGIIPILFRMGLNGNVVRSGPEMVRRAYNEITEGASVRTDLPKIVEGVSIQIYDTETSAKPNFRLEKITLEGLEVLKTENSEGDEAIVLCFETEYPFEAEIWQKMGRFYKTDVWLVFDSAQASLLDQPEPVPPAPKKAKPTGQQELLPKEPKAKAAKKDGKAAAAGDAEPETVEAES